MSKIQIQYTLGHTVPDSFCRWFWKLEEGAVTPDRQYTKDFLQLLLWDWLGQDA